MGKVLPFRILSKRYPLEKGHVVVILVITPEGIPIIRNPKKSAPDCYFWRLPRGRGEATETAEGCAVRVLREELGTSLSEGDLGAVYAEDRGTYTLTIFRAELAALPQMKSQGDEGEEIGVFKPQDILGMWNFLPNYWQVVRKILHVLSMLVNELADSVRGFLHWLRKR